jgi:hypothetical protein
MVQVWTNGEDRENLSKLVNALEKHTVDRSGAQLQTFIIVLTDKEGRDEVARKLTEIAGATRASKIHLTYLDRGDNGVRGYRVNLAPEVKNTIFVYRDRRVTDKFVNLKADEEGLRSLNDAIVKITQ